MRLSLLSVCVSNHSVFLWNILGILIPRYIYIYIQQPKNTIPLMMIKAAKSQTEDALLMSISYTHLCIPCGINSKSSEYSGINKHLINISLPWGRDVHKCTACYVPPRCFSPLFFCHNVICLSCPVLSWCKIASAAKKWINSATPQVYLRRPLPSLL